MKTDISKAGQMASVLAQQLESAEDSVSRRMADLLRATDLLREAIIKRDTIQTALNLTAQFVERETESDLADALRYMVQNIGQPMAVETRDGFRRAAELVARFYGDA